MAAGGNSGNFLSCWHSTNSSKGFHYFLHSTDRDGIRDDCPHNLENSSTTKKSWPWPWPWPRLQRFGLSHSTSFEV